VPLFEALEIIHNKTSSSYTYNYIILYSENLIPISVIVLFTSLIWITAYKFEAYLVGK